MITREDKAKPNSCYRPTSLRQLGEEAVQPRATGGSAHRGGGGEQPRGLLFRVIKTSVGCVYNT